ncbi:hypothetical protein KM317_06150 [Xanthomonas translucens pv. arrhenatheri]|uniref:hypothetical protein n=1 Tax=Xanthomonas graminis TaxID=3390026 RepID=UPI0018C8653C|nr:hypothetical protein [Xanthomonas translucens]UKE78805.1 hypothetical protein KM317_06150 [Xanthomonas translucens pv. arrhenatheri]
MAPLASPAIGRAIALHANSPAPATHTGNICARSAYRNLLHAHAAIAIGPDPCGGHAPAAQGRRGVAVAHTAGVQQCRRQQRVALRQPQISGVSNSNRSQWPTIASPKSSGPLRVHWPWSLRAIKFQAGTSMCMKRGCAGGEKSPARCDVQRRNEAVVWMDVVRSVQCRVRASSANGGRRHSKALQPSPRWSAQYTSRR